MKKFWRNGDPWIWLTGGALAICLVMVFALLAVVFYHGMSFFWPKDLTQISLKDGSTVLGAIVQREVIPQPDLPEESPQRYRILVKRGNRDLNGADFVWIDEDSVIQRSQPADAMAIERREWGNFYGRMLAVWEGSTLLAKGKELGTPALEAMRERTSGILAEIRRIEKEAIGEINAAQEENRLRRKSLTEEGSKDSSELERLDRDAVALQKRYEEQIEKIRALRGKLTANLLVEDASGRERTIPLDQVVRVYWPNEMGLWGKVGFYLSKLWEFVSDEPRESNTEGGVFPAIFGTVMMVLLMSLLVTPLGVLAAFYLREYAKQGPFVSAVRIAVNNLAGVPSIVFGVFGVGFFVYFVGGSIDKLFYADALPTPTFGTGGILWASLTLALLTVPVVIVATEEGLAAIPRGMREASLALGATKFETTWKVVLPAVMPSILTGLILAMARAAGEVAPLMITGVVKLAPTLPVDGEFPFVHFERKFMHLGFHIFDVGFQSPNVDAARPMVFATTLLLLAIVLFLNIGAISLRNRLRKKFALSAL